MGILRPVLHEIDAIVTREVGPAQRPAFVNRSKPAQVCKLPGASDASSGLLLGGTDFMARKAERRELLKRRDELRALVRSGVSSYARSELQTVEQRLVEEQGFEWALDGSGVAVPQGMGRSANAQLPDTGAESHLRPDFSVREAEYFRTGGIRKGRTGMEVGIGVSQARSIGSADSSTAPTTASNAGATEATTASVSTSVSVSSTSMVAEATLPAPPAHPHIKTTPMRATPGTSAATGVSHSTGSSTLAQEPTSAASFLMHPLTGIATAVGSMLRGTPGLQVPVSMKPVSPADSLAAAPATPGPSRVVVSPLATSFPSAVRSGAAQAMTKSASATTPLVVSAAQVPTAASATPSAPVAQTLPPIATLMQGLAPPGASPSGPSSLPKL